MAMDTIIADGSTFVTVYDVDGVTRLATFELDEVLLHICQDVHLAN